MTQARLDPLAYYACNDDLTDLSNYAGQVADLPADPAKLVPIIQGLLIHAFWLERYGVALAAERKLEPGIRPLPLKLAKLLEVDERPLTEARPLDRRLVCTCRDFTLFLCALLRHKGVPARARCGFGTYFNPGTYEDHWVGEYWNKTERRWVMVDAQLDALQRKALNITFDPLDLPSGVFITGGRAWQMCRSEGAAPNLFGIFQWRGLGFIRGDLIRDFLALNKIEILPWDLWGLMLQPDENMPAEEVQLLDRMAELTLAGNQQLGEMRKLYTHEPRLHLPPEYAEQTLNPMPG